MLIGEVSKSTGLTKKAIEYYTETGLVAPSILENGYRDFGPDQVERLKVRCIQEFPFLQTDDAHERILQRKRILRCVYSCIKGAESILCRVL
ncbi:MAG: MerR family transcriptional regulator [Christensenellales bacterium]|jgi:hypothetical protein